MWKKKPREKCMKLIIFSYKCHALLKHSPENIQKGVCFIGIVVLVQIIEAKILNKNKCTYRDILVH